MELNFLTAQTVIENGRISLCVCVCVCVCGQSTSGAILSSTTCQKSKGLRSLSQRRPVSPSFGGTFPTYVDPASFFDRADAMTKSVARWNADMIWGAPCLRLETGSWSERGGRTNSAVLLDLNPRERWKRYWALGGAQAFCPSLGSRPTTELNGARRQTSYQEELRLVIRAAGPPHSFAVSWATLVRRHSDVGYFLLYINSIDLPFLEAGRRATITVQAGCVFRGCSVG